MSMAENKKIGLITAVVIIVAAAYFLFIAQKSEDSPVVIGFIGPLTGDNSDKGEHAKAAVELAVEKINETGGVNGHELMMVYKDGGCDSIVAHEAAADLIQNHQVSAILGGLCSHETLSFTDMAEHLKVVVLSYCSTAPEISSSGDYIFRINPSSVDHAYFDAKYVRKVMNKQRVAILSVDAPWGVGLADTFSEVFTEEGGEIVAQELHQQTDTDLSGQITRIKESNPEVLYFLGYPGASVAGLKQMQEAGLNIPILGSSTWDNPAVWQGVESVGEEILYSTAFSPLNDEFINDMRDRFGIDQILNCIPQAYDGINVLSQVINEVGSDTKKIKDALYTTVYKSGISSDQIEFDENGDVVDSTYLIKKIEDGKAVKVEYYRTDQYGEVLRRG